ncbi:Gfo/Idh/MocA family oxidoreductase [Alphaproteobacteria bacterium]|nr:Gfo/Idh/MocA family oxidoreductase [Alphaproteobacteria bacterium]
MKSNLGILSSNINSLYFLNNNKLYDHLNFHSIASRNIKDSKKFASIYNFNKYYGSYEDIINDSDIDIVVNFLPNSIKFEYTYLLLKAGKKVITNYPVFNSLNDLNSIKEIIKSSYSLNLFLIYDFDFTRLINNDIKNIIYIKNPDTGSANMLNLMTDYLNEESPDLFFLLHHYKKENIDILYIDKKFDSLHNRLIYFNAYISINDQVKINIIIDNMNPITSNPIIINGISLSMENTKKIISKKAFNYDDLIGFIKNNKTFENDSFFQYYPYQLLNEVINV